MMEVRKTTPEDMEYVLDNAIDPQAKTVPQNILTQPAFTGLWEGKIMGVGGINWYWEGVGEGWIILTKNTQDNPMGSYRTIKMLFKSVLKEDFQRIQAVVRTDWKQANKMVKKLGFKKEGKLRKYCPNGDDAWIYSIIK